LIKNKINVDGKTINSVKNQFLYVASHLEGKRLQLALIFITINKDIFDASATRLLNYLNSIFDDRYKAQRAVEILYTMKQSFRKLFSIFLLYFEKALADTEKIA
jgi:hypothetical protein